MESFETYRPYLFAIAYRMLGSAMDAEDMVQETYLRSQATPLQTIRSLKAYLTTILVRLCMDQLQLARRKRELYVGFWLPEPILTEETPEAADPEKRVETEESIELAFLVLLEQLQPFERAVFLLREVFAYEILSFMSVSHIVVRTCTHSMEWVYFDYERSGNCISYLQEMLVLAGRLLLPTLVLSESRDMLSTMGPIIMLYSL